MKSNVSKGLAIGALVLVVLVVLAVGGGAMNRASGPEIDRSKPPADFMDPKLAPKK